MIVLDTNVVSELMKATPDTSLRHWVGSVPGAERFMAAVTVAELGYGVERLPSGLRRDLLREAVAAVVREDFADRILPLDEAAAGRYGALKNGRDRDGRPIGIPDALIAAICLHHRATLATRNTRDFDDLGLTLVDPWKE